MSKLPLLNVNFFSIICDKVTIVDCQTWIIVHEYVVRKYVHVPMLLIPKRITGGARFDNLTKVLLEALQELGGLSNEQIWEKLLCFGAVVFHGIKNGVTV